MSKPMSKKQFHDALEALELTITGAAPYTGMSPRQLQRIAAGSPVPGPLAKLLRVAIDHKIPLEELEKA